MIAAQGLGTVLRLARKLGPVIGKVVAVVGQGQNGLIATRLMSQFAAKAVIAIDPVSCSNTDVWHTFQLLVLDALRRTI
jgi:threonine dehydrogenase-like Zn-dependent dehydrogenase